MAEFAFRLPLNIQLGKVGSKHLLRGVLYKHIPLEIIDRPKQGFVIPLREWLQGDLSELLDEYLRPSRIRGAWLLDSGVVRQEVKAFKKGRGVDVTRVWLLLVFEMWREML